jgi:hypothetical protein
MEKTTTLIEQTPWIKECGCWLQCIVSAAYPESLAYDPAESCM